MSHINKSCKTGCAKTHSTDLKQLFARINNSVSYRELQEAASHSSMKGQLFLLLHYCKDLQRPTDLPGFPPLKSRIVGTG